MGEIKWSGTETPTYNMLRIQCLGSFKVFLPGIPETPIEGSAHKSWALLKYMIAHKETPVPTEWIMDIFWPNRKNPGDTAALRTALCRLKSMLHSAPTKNRQPSVILFRKDTCRLNAHAPVWIDSVEFEKQCALARQIGMKDRQAGVSLYLGALELYRGDFLAEDLYHEWTTIPREFYRRLFIEATAEAATWLIELKQYQHARHLLEQAINRDPLVEELHYLLLQAFIKQDELKAALKHYVYCTSMLTKELGVKPSAKLRSIYQLIREKDLSSVDYFELKEEFGIQSQFDGPMVCDPEQFWNFILFERRQVTRNGGEACLAVLEVGFSEEQAKRPKIKVMNVLEKILRQSLRGSDLICRLDGRHLALLLPGTSLQGGEAAVEHIKKAFFEVISPSTAQIRFQSKIKSIPKIEKENMSRIAPSPKR